jgi:putative FmdB family regulatory protein
MLCSAVSGSRILPFTPSARRLGMPHYEFFCHSCKKTFSRILALVDYEEGEVICPHCGGKEVEQSWSAFTAITSRKSA